MEVIDMDKIRGGFWKISFRSFNNKWRINIK